MPLRKLYPTQSLGDVIWHYLVYLEARLLQDPNAQDLASKVTALITQVENTWLDQRNVWRAVTQAQAGVDYRNFVLDRDVLGHARALMISPGINFDTNHPRFKRYYTEPPSRIIQMALESEIRLVNTWIDSLKSETDTTVQVFADIFANHVAEAEKILAALRKAKADRKDHRVRQIHELVKTINDGCREIFGLLTARAPSLGLDEAWADSFFYRPQRASQEEDPAYLLRSAIYAVFSARKLEASEGVSKRLEETEDQSLLDSWMKAAVSAKSAEEAVGLPPKEEKPS